MSSTVIGVSTRTVPTDQESKAAVPIVRLSARRGDQDARQTSHHDGSGSTNGKAGGDKARNPDHRHGRHKATEREEATHEETDQRGNGSLSESTAARYDTQEM
jgi:hypothetical protein